MPEEKQKKSEQEFELIPVSPLRRLEKRIEQLEVSSEKINSREFYKELVDIIRMNQMLVDELAKANDALRIELSRLPSRLEELVSKLNELISYIKASASEEIVPSISSAPSEGLKSLVDKIGELLESNKKIVESNQSMLAALEEIERRLKRPPLPPSAIRKPILFPPKSI